jgi:hypothetical protein
MTCDLARHLLDDYLEDEISLRQRQRLEQHLSECSCCSQELRQRLAFEHNLQQALTASVHHLQLAPESCRGIVQAVEASLGKPAWPWSAAQVARVMGGGLVAALLMIALFAIFGRVPVPLGVEQGVRSAANRPALSVDLSSITFEPEGMAPGDLFTVTVPIESDLLQGVDAIRCDLDIRGPTGRYRFALFMEGPLPAHGLSILQVTPELLAAPSQEQYQLSPQEIFGESGVYTLGVTLFSPVVTPAE